MKNTFNVSITDSDIFIASDHRGFELKGSIFNELKSMNKNIFDLGPYIFDINDDYPDYASKLGEVISDNSCGILICGSGNGMIIAANKFPNVRAILAYNIFSVEMGRKHNNANVIVIPSDLINSVDDTMGLIKIWLSTLFDNEERHNRRLDKIRLYSRD
jgi:ribose 5-phosphate isomerase B